MKLYWFSVLLLVAGLIMVIAGGWVTAKAVIIDAGTAHQLAGMAIETNRSLETALLEQSRAASLGLVWIVIGSLCQLAGTLLQAWVARPQAEKLVGALVSQNVAGR